MPEEKKNYIECGIKFKQKSNGYYIAVIYVPYKGDLKKPKKRYEISATTVSAMREKIRDFVALSNKCDINFLYRGTFESYATEWLSKKKAIAERKGKFGGYERVQYSFVKYIIPKLGRKKLLDITFLELQSFINEYGAAYSKSSTDKILGPLKQLFTYAYENKYIPSNPTLLLHGLNSHNYGVETKQVLALSREVKAQFEEACKATFSNGRLKYRLGYAYLLILNTGLRKGELLALQWSDIDFFKKQLNVNKAIARRTVKGSRVEVIEEPKTKTSIRTIPLNNKSLDALQHLKELNKDSELVIATRENKRIASTMFSDSLNNIQRAYHLPFFGSHVLRHTFATRLYENGIRVDIISKLMGHSSVNMTYNYIHTSNEVLHEYMSKAKLYNTEIELDD
ncbi:MAG: site-specific integrase [Firmicutes bacterium]|nr:site-specific integrase [Bacillota bacterium]